MSFKKSLKRILLLLLFPILLFNLCIQGVKAQESEEKDWKGVLGKVIQETEYNETKNEENSLALIIGKFIEIILGLLGVAFIILTIYAGALWMNAGGNEETIGKSKTIIKNSLIGLLITLSAYAITYAVLKNLTTITNGTDGHSTGFHLND